MKIQELTLISFILKEYLEPYYIGNIPWQDINIHECKTEDFSLGHGVMSAHFIECVQKIARSIDVTRALMSFHGESYIADNNRSLDCIFTEIEQCQNR